MKASPRTPRLRRSTLAAGLAAAAALASAPAADAAFSRNTAPCSGGAAGGAGASFQANAHNNLWIPIAYENFCAPNGGKGASSIVPYPGSSATGRTGSGYGRRVVGERTGDNANGALSRNRPTGERFGATDEPPTNQQLAQMELGTDATGDEGDVRTIPVAVGAVAAVVNLPDGCTPGAGDLDSDGSGRIRVSQVALEQVWAGTTETWADLLTDEAAGTCTQQIKRVRRRDDGGTTFVFKDFLDKVAPSRGWRTTFITPDTRNWPDSADDLIIPEADGNGGQADGVIATDGSFGYTELGTARSKAFTRTSDTDDTYWLRVQNGAGAYADPSAGSNTHTSSARSGANCESVAFANLPGGPSDPDATLQSWGAVTGVNTNVPTEYAICSLTYLLAFDDHADAYGNTAEEEAKARTVKDFVTAVLEQGQSGLPSVVDQSPLPTQILTRASAGANAIDWCKGGCGGAGTNTDTGGGNTNTGGGGGGTNTPAQNTPIPQPIAQISNLFSIRSVRTRGSDVVVSLRLPGAGRAQVTAAGTARRRVNRRLRTRRFSFATAAVTVAQAGDVSVRLPRTRRATNELKRARGKRGTVLVTVRFTPNGGQPREQNFTRRIAVRYTRPAG